jgi:TrmH family RNA methyltransferase
MISKQKMSYIRQLQQKKFREETGHYIVEGWKSIDEAVNAGVPVETIVFDEMNADQERLLAKFEKHARQVLAASRRDLDSLSDTVTSQGVIAVVAKFDPEKHVDSIRSDATLIVALDGINDPGNLGTIIRTCDWFGVDGIIIGRHSVELYNPKVVRATMGSLFHLPVVPEVNLPEFLSRSKKNGFSIVSAEVTDSKDIRTAQLPERCAIVIGSESHGVSEQISLMADMRLSIPQFGKAESLNAAIACGIILASIKLKSFP